MRGEQSYRHDRNRADYHWYSLAENRSCQAVDDGADDGRAGVYVFYNYVWSLLSHDVAQKPASDARYGSEENGKEHIEK